MIKRLRTLFAMSGVLCAAAVTASAQTTQAPPPTSLKGLLLDISVKSGVPPQLGEQVVTFGAIMGLEVSTAPLGTSTGGFTYTFDKQLQTFTRSSTSFGPTFAERSLTAGKGKFSIGFNWLHSGYNSLAGQDLTNGDFRPTRNATVIGNPASYSVGKFDVSSDTVVGLATVGITERLDVGIGIPWVRISMSADESNFTASNIDLFQGHHLGFGTTTATGVGDVAIFGKYHIWRHNDGGIAGELTVRLPTGDTDNLQGIGVTRTMVSGIWSQRLGKISPHVNLGYEFWSADVPLAPSRNVSAKDQFEYAFGVEFAVHPRATANVDVVGRRLLNGGQIGYTKLDFGAGQSVEALLGLPEGLNVVSLAPGIKWNIWRSALITGNVLASLANNGLRANLTPVLGIEWAF